MTTPTETREDEEALPALAQALQDWTASLRILLDRLFKIAVLETRLAALSFVLILIIGIASGLLLASAWIALFAAIVTWFHALGLSWPISLLLMAGINFFLAIVGCYAIYRMSNNLMFRAIRKFILATEIHDGNAATTADRNQQPAQ
ncbi:MAG: hypothetical protein JWM78_1290 [Verrucomicrobiaceae bacterium]|nr:hypothetical protein [Verrucomicrobiaceae bacterium]